MEAIELYSYIVPSVQFHIIQMNPVNDL